jgi:glycerate kinase
VVPSIIAAVDVKNPLLGQNGATRVFGPQKGASESDLDNLERALARLADVVAADFGLDYRNEAGAGAAGGLGFGLLSFCGATIQPGFEVVAEAVRLESKMKDADLVITGEGSPGSPDARRKDSSRRGAASTKAPKASFRNCWSRV